MEATSERPRRLRELYTQLPITKVTREKVRALKKELGFRTYDALLNYAVLEIRAEGAIPPADYDLVFLRDGSRPCVITAESGGGKTTTVKELLSHWMGNVLIFDVSDEYKELRALDLGKFFSIGWTRPNQRIRFVPDSNVEISKVEATTIFSRLAFEMHSGHLKDWVIIVEEGHRFSADPNLRALLIEARKFVRKLVLITTDWRVYQGVAKVYKPRPWEPEVK